MGNPEAQADRKEDASTNAWLGPGVGREVEAEGGHGATASPLHEGL